MNKQRTVMDLPTKSSTRNLSNKAYIAIGFIAATIFFSLFFVARESLAQSSQLGLVGNEAIEVLCDGRAMRIQRISRTQLTLTCRAHRGEPNPPTPMPEPTQPPAQPTRPAPQPTMPAPDPDPEPQPPADARFVAPNGDDANPGTIERPFRTIQHGVNQVNAGQTLYVREGVYNEYVRVTKSGAADRPIQIAAYRGERVVLDGRYQLPYGEPARCNTTVSPERCFVYTALLTIQGNHIVVDGIQVTQSRGRGIGIAGASNSRVNNVTVRNCKVYEVRSAGVHVHYADNVRVDGCEVFQAANYATHNRSSSDLDWPVIVTAIYSQDVTFANNIVHENYGEGMAAGRNSVGLTFKNNTIYDNYALQLYIHRSQDVTVDGNLLYHTGNPNFLRGGVPSSCIAINAEAQFADAATIKNVRITNNIITGCKYNVDLWGNNQTGLVSENILIAHNTLVNASADPNRVKASGLRVISANAYRSVRFENNIIVQEQYDLAQVPNSSNITFANNLWSKQPPSSASGPGDVIGSPNLMNPVSALPGGGVDAGWFGIQPSSPAVDSGRQIAEVTTDYFGQPRLGLPDIGAYEQGNR